LLLGISFIKKRWLQFNPNYAVEGLEQSELTALASGYPDLENHHFGVIQ
jgi:hypothetical protein